MQLKHVVETAEGPTEVTLNLSEDEVKFVMEIGLNVLYAHGSIPFLSKDVDLATIQPSTQTAQ